MQFQRRLQAFGAVKTLRGPTTPLHNGQIVVSHFKIYFFLFKTFNIVKSVKKTNKTKKYYIKKKWQCNSDFEIHLCVLLLFSHISTYLKKHNLTQKLFDYMLCTYVYDLTRGNTFLFKILRQKVILYYKILLLKKKNK